MRYFTVIAFLLIAQLSFGQSTKKAKIDWKTFEEVQVLMKTAPKKVFVDVYTHWCGPCKWYTKNTLQNKKVAEYINKYYYAIKFNAETPDTIVFMDSTFTNPRYVPNNPGRNGTHQLTNLIARTQSGIAYPSTVIFNESWHRLTAQAGAFQKEQILPILKFIGEDIYKKKSFKDFTESSQPAKKSKKN